jgi:hypothetical protein
MRGIELTRVAENIFSSGGARDMVQAWFMACQRNPELKSMTPDDMESLVPGVSDHKPGRSQSNVNGRAWSVFAWSDWHVPSGKTRRCFSSSVVN